MSSGSIDLGATFGSGGGGGVTSLNTLTGAVVLVAGTNITLTPAGNNITIAASGGGSSPSRTAVSTTTYTTLSTDVIIGMTNTAARTVTLISAASLVSGQEFKIKDEAGTATTANVTIVTSGGQTIDGASSITITKNYGIARFYTDGSNFFTE